MKNKSKEFVKNTIIIFLGKFSTQFMSFLLLPLYTYFLSSSDYGYVDLIQTYISLCVPILTLRFDSAAFRFLVDKRDDLKKQEEIFSNIIFSLFFQIIFFVIIYGILGYFIHINYYFYIMINIIVMMCSNILLQVTRGLGNNKEYSVACFLTGFSTLIVNIILIIVFHFNAKSILISSSFANLICVIYLILKMKLKKKMKLQKISKTKIVKIAKYSIPMIPNSLSWWIVNVSDRSIISFVLGTAFNGIYSVSCKFSNILNSIFGIISISWQETASLYIDSKDADSLFSKIINEIISLFSCITFVMLSAIAVFFNLIVGANYIEAYNYIPILLVANIFNIYIGLYGGIYIAKKLTVEIAKTTIFSAILNILINLLLIQKFGLYAAAFSTFISYFVIALYRHYDVKKYINIKLNLKKNGLLMLFIFISSAFFLTKNLLLNSINLFLGILITFLINKSYLIKLKNKFMLKEKKNA